MCEIYARSVHLYNNNNKNVVVEIARFMQNHFAEDDQRFLKMLSKSDLQTDRTDIEFRKNDYAVIITRYRISRAAAPRESDRLRNP